MTVSGVLKDSEMIQMIGTRANTMVALILEKWVETRQLISKTRSDWQADKDTIEQTIALYERELKSIDEQMSKVSTNNTQVAKEMEEAEGRNPRTKALDRAREFATKFEAKLKLEVPKLPEPLQDIVKKDMARIPADPANTKMLPAERIQVAWVFSTSATSSTTP